MWAARSLQSFRTANSLHLVFASVPSIEAQLLNPKTSGPLFILDLSSAHRIETAAAKCLPRWTRDLELRDFKLAICGLQSGGQLHSDFKRAGVPLVFDVEEKGDERGILAFETREACLTWCRGQHELRALAEGGFEFSSSRGVSTLLHRFIQIANSTAGSNYSVACLNLSRDRSSVCQIWTQMQHLKASSTQEGRSSSTALAK
jgi:hypothetical protein